MVRRPIATTTVAVTSGRDFRNGPATRWKPSPRDAIKGSVPVQKKAMTSAALPGDPVPPAAKAPCHAAQRPREQRRRVESRAVSSKCEDSIDTPGHHQHARYDRGHPAQPRERAESFDPCA
jgi:hypothetical protein